MHLEAVVPYLELTLNIPGRKGKGSSRVNIAFGDGSLWLSGMKGGEFGFPGGPRAGM